MRKLIRKIIPVMLALTLTLSVLPPARAAETYLDDVIADTATVLQSTVTSPGIAQTGGDWTIIALTRSGVTVPDAFYQLYYDNAVSYLKSCGGVLSTTKHSEYSRVALAMTALGVDARNIAGIDIFASMFDSNLAVNQGVNGPIFALITLCATGYAEHDICGQYIDYILSKHLPDGGFAMSGDISDPDTTALALTALSGYMYREDVSAAAKTGIDRLSRLQRDTGGFTSYSVVNSESVSQAIIAVSTLGIPVDDARFVKNGNSMLDNLLEYYIPGEGFEHELGRGVDLMATEQALCALAAIRRQQSGLSTLYDMTDAEPVALAKSGDGLPGKQDDISVPKITLPDTSFDDIGGIGEEAAIHALARRGIVNGYPSGGFAPDKTLTRAEFASIIVRALGLKARMGESTEFADVTPDAWYYDAVNTATRYAIILGRDDGAFAPGDTITRQEASLMIARAANLCGMDTSQTETSTRNILSQFTDYRQIADWASYAMAFCYGSDLLDQSDIKARPNDDILRREMAELTYRLLVAAMLIEPAGAQ